LKYKEEEYDKGVKYYGYVNQQGLREGVGIRMNQAGHKERAEWL
jgi:hypothetical protein